MSPLLILLLFAAGVAFLLIELMVPSLGLLFMVSLACFGLSVYGSFQYGDVFGIVNLVLILAACLIAGRWALNRLSHKDTQADDPGYHASTEGLAALLDAAGRTLTPLRPGGVAQIAGRRVDVVTRGEFVEAGTAVKVIEVEGNRVVVRAVRGEDGAPARSRRTAPGSPGGA